MRQREARGGIGFRSATTSGPRAAARRGRRNDVERLEGRRLLAAVGPDAFGYTADPHPFENVNLSPGDAGVQAVLTGATGGGVAVPLGGNTFSFYGQTYAGQTAATSLYVNVDGLLTFGAPSDDPNNDGLTGRVRLATIAPLWDDWVTNVDANDQVLTKLDAENRRLIVEWNFVRSRFNDPASTIGPVTFQAILELNTGDRPGSITFNYPDIQTELAATTNGASATVGIKEFGDFNPRRLLISQDNAANPLLGSAKAIRIGTNQPPVIQPTGDFTVDEGGQVELSATATDSDTLSYAWDLDNDGSFETPGQRVMFSAVGIDGPAQRTVRVSVSDGQNPAVVQSVVVQITNAAPTAAPETYRLSEDGTLTVGAANGVLANDTDPGGDALTPIVLGGVQSGTLVLFTDGGFTYTPDPDAFGTEEFAYQVRDDDGALSAPVSVTIEVAPVNDAPVANDDAYTGDEDQEFTVAAAVGLLANDRDVDGDELSLAVLTLPRSGTLLVRADGSFVYTPAGNFNGTDSFTYRVRDRSGLSDSATVSLTVNPVNDTPHANNDSYSTPEDTPLVVAAPGVLHNDPDADGDVLAASVETPPAHGTLALAGDGSFTYTPHANYHGPDSFTYRAVDASTGSGVATVNIEVISVNDVPVAADDSASTDEDLAVSGNVLGNDTDVESEAAPAAGVASAGDSEVTTSESDGGAEPLVSLDPDDGSEVVQDDAQTSPLVAPEEEVDADVATTAAADTSGAGGLRAELVSGPANGDLVLLEDGSYTYTPDANFFGTDSFTYRAVDADGASSTATVTVTVAEVNDTPVAGGDAAATDEDVAVVVDVLANDADPDNGDGLPGNEDALHAQIVVAPANGTAVVNTDGTITYTPDANYFGVDHVTYVVVDGNGAASSPAVASVAVAEVNDAPVAWDDVVDTTNGAPLLGNVLLNDVDPDNRDASILNDDVLSAALVSGPSSGTLSLEADGRFTYTPAAGFSGTDTFSYRVTDGDGAGGVATVTINVTAATAQEGTVQLVPDATRPGTMALVINGTSRGDLLAVLPAPGGAVEVFIGVESRGVFSPGGRIVIYAGGGNDLVLVTASAAGGVWAYGDDGNDAVHVGSGGGIAFGGAGDDALFGGTGRDLLVGGEGADRVHGLSGDDVLVGGVTAYDARGNATHEAAWSALRAEWLSTRLFADRVKALRDGSAVGLNGTYRLNDSTVHDDDAGYGDILFGASGDDWFLYKFGEDRIPGGSSTEMLHDLTVD